MCSCLARRLLDLPQERDGSRVRPLYVGHLIADADRFCRTIRLPGSDGPIYTTTSDSGPLATLASIPWFLVGLGGIAYESVASQFNTFRARYRARRGYRHVPVDEDAQILRFEDED